MKVNTVLVNFAQNCQVIHSFMHPVYRGIAEPSEGVMPNLFNQFVSTVFVSSLAVPMFLFMHWDAVAASECVGKPDRPVNQAGHWHYHVDRVHHRRCWYFEPSKATVSAAASADRVPAQNTDSQQSWVSRLTTSLAKTFSKQPQQNTVVDNSIVETKLTSPQHLRTNKIVSRERSQTKPPPATNGIAIAERRDQLLGNGEKNEKPAPQLTDTERQALFDDFLKWYQDRSVFGGRER